MKARLALSALLFGCGGEVLQGADAVPPRDVPKQRVLAVFTPEQCVDGSTRAAVSPATEITLLAREDGKLLLVEARPGYDSLVVHNAFETARSLTFQAIATPEDADPALREFQIDWPSAASGKLTSSLAFEIGEAGDRGFRASISSAALLCKLVQKGRPADLDRGGPLRYEPRSAPDNVAGASPR